MLQEKSEEQEQEKLSSDLDPEAIQEVVHHILALPSQAANTRDNRPSFPPQNYCGGSRPSFCCLSSQNKYPSLMTIDDSCPFIGISVSYENHCTTELTYK